MKESDLPGSLIIGKTRGGKIAQISQTFSTFMEKNLSFISAQGHAEKLMFPLNV